MKVSLKAVSTIAETLMPLNSAMAFASKISIGGSVITKDFLLHSCLIFGRGMGLKSEGLDPAREDYHPSENPCFS